MPVPPPPQVARPFSKVPMKSRVSVVFSIPVSFLIAKNADEPVVEMFWVVKELRLKAGPPLPWHQSPPFPFVVWQGVAAVRLTTSLAIAVPEKTPLSTAAKPIATHTEINLLMAIPPAFCGTFVANLRGTEKGKLTMPNSPHHCKPLHDLSTVWSIVCKRQEFLRRKKPKRNGRETGSLILRQTVRQSENGWLATIASMSCLRSCIIP
jgi:hypothetical protein